MVAGAYDGQIVNYSTLSSALGVSRNTVKSYYALMEDTFVCGSLHAYSGSFRSGTYGRHMPLTYDIGYPLPQSVRPA